MDINNEIQTQVDAVIAEKLPDLVREKVTKMLENVLGDIFSQWGGVSKKIQKQIEEKLDINLQQYDLIDYNALIGEAINENLISLVNEQSIKPIMKLVNKTVGFLEKKEWKLTEVHALVKNAAREYSSDKTSGNFSFFVEYHNEYKWHEVGIDIEQKKNLGDCAVRFHVNGKSGTMFCFHAKNWWYQQHTKVTPAVLTGLSDLEHKIFRLYSAQAVITVDVTDFEDENYWDLSD